MPSGGTGKPPCTDLDVPLGVSSRDGESEEAIARYRKLALDPYMAAARGNLAAAYCGCGKMEDGIREFRKVLEINPNYALVRAGLARAYFTRGAYREAIEQCDRAMEQGWRFEPSMLEVLNRYRSQLP
jgi:tetratricopeptide (TPR) repeat protein